MIVPSGSLEADPSKETVWPAVGRNVLGVYAAVGFSSGTATVKPCPTAAVCPALSVTYRPTLYTPAAANAWVGVAPLPSGVPSPHTQR